MIALIGGTGPEGKGLALRFAAAGEIVMIGSRYRERAVAAAEEVRHRVPDAWVRGALNRRAAREADIIVLTVPFEGHARILQVDPRRTSAARSSSIPSCRWRSRRAASTSFLSRRDPRPSRRRRMLPETRVVAAFLNLSAVELADLDRPLDADVVVCGDNVAARNVTMSLINRIPGLRAVNGDGLASAHHLEEITALLLTLNRIHRAHTSIKITGI